MSSSDGQQVPQVGAYIESSPYRSFEGQRTSARGAILTITVESARSVMGLGLKARSKIFPFGLIVVATLAVSSFTLSAVGAPWLEADVLNRMLEATGVTSFWLYLFAAFAAPQILTLDRANGMLAMYFSTPISRLSYVVAKSVALSAIQSAFMLGPPLVALALISATGYGPDGPADFMAVLGLTVAFGLTIAIVTSMVSLAVSAYTTSRAAASVAFIALTVGSLIPVGLLVAAADSADLLVLLNLIAALTALGGLMSGESASDLEVASPAIPILAVILWAGAGFWLFWARYRKMQV